MQRIAKVHDQHLSFIALEAGLFSLGLPNSYLAINDPGANDTQIEASLTDKRARCVYGPTNRIAGLNCCRYKYTDPSCVCLLLHGPVSCTVEA